MNKNGDTFWHSLMQGLESHYGANTLSEKESDKALANWLKTEINSVYGVTDTSINKTSHEDEAEQD